MTQITNTTILDIVANFQAFFQAGMVALAAILATLTVAVIVSQIRTYLQGIAYDAMGEEEVPEQVPEEEAVTEEIATEEIAEEEILACLSAEDLTGQEILNAEVHIYTKRQNGEYKLSRSMVSNQEKVQATTCPILEIHDNVVYLDTEYAPEQDVQVMESTGVDAKEHVQMAIWSCRRGFRSMVKFVKDLAAAPTRIAELEKELAELKKQQFDFDFYSDDEDREVVTWVNKA